MTLKKLVVGRNAKKIGVVPAIILCNPKNDYNVGGVQRAASNFGIKQVWFTGNRVRLEPEKGQRLPREERMKGYDEVDVIQYDYPFDMFEKHIPVIALEVKNGSQCLAAFEHPPEAVYVFGPEDGSIPKALLPHCHQFVQIPTRHCLNLSAAVNVVLYDRILKHWWNDVAVLPTLGEHRGILGQ